jgi:transcriptional regulator with XRE-family HTH domain
MKTVFVERLEKLLKETKISQKDLAQDIGVTESAISKYLSGDRTPNSDILLNLATALHTTSDYLLGLNTSDDDKQLKYSEIKGLLARNAKDLSPEQKNKLIQIIVKY